MAVAGPEVRVEGLTQLLRDLKEADAGLYREVRKTVIEVGEVVKDDAQERAGTEIRNIGPAWSQMRLGMSGGSVVYVAPRQRRKSGSPRPNLARLLLERAMVPAAEEGTPIIAEKMTDAINELHANAGLVDRLHALT